MKTIQEIIPNKISETNEIITKENISNDDEDDRNNKKKTSLDQTTPKLLVKIGSKTPKKKEKTIETMKDADRRPKVIISMIYLSKEIQLTK